MGGTASKSETEQESSVSRSLSNQLKGGKKQSGLQQAVAGPLQGRLRRLAIITSKSPRGKMRSEHEARIVDRCEVGKDCCALGILEAQPNFATEKPHLETF